jgi:hypothetical protein
LCNESVKELIVGQVSINHPEQAIDRGKAAITGEDQKKHATEERNRMDCPPKTDRRDKNK